MESEDGSIVSVRWEASSRRNGEIKMVEIERTKPVHHSRKVGMMLREDHLYAVERVNAAAGEAKKVSTSPRRRCAGLVSGTRESVPADDFRLPRDQSRQPVGNGHDVTYFAGLRIRENSPAEWWVCRHPDKQA